MKSFSNETLNFFLQKVLGLQHFGSCQNCMSSANLVAMGNHVLVNMLPCSSHFTEVH